VMLLARLEAVAERQPRMHRLPPAEMGCPETGAEFARYVKDHFTLLGPGVRKEGAGGTKVQHQTCKTLQIEVVRRDLSRKVEVLKTMHRVRAL
jgi:hypothetical protein